MSGQVEELNTQFYKAFEAGSYQVSASSHAQDKAWMLLGSSSGSVQEMEQIWGTGPSVQCMHPMSNCVRGRADVRLSQRARHA